MRIDTKKPSEFGPNELNRKNTFRGSESVEFEISGFRFRLGFWPTPYDGKIWPFAALIVWKETGWEVVALDSMIINDDLGMEMGDPREDLRQYMWYIGQDFSPNLRDFLEANQVRESFDENWQKVLELFKTVRWEDSELKFDSYL